MVKHSCLNIASADENNYSAPVPIIGLYIAGPSLVCFLLMISDIIHGIRHRKLWLPCRWYSLNSVTLTLLSIAAKLPVDLTTPMPSSLDQFSKLTGTAFICVSMGFLMPSLGTNSASECVTNMLALSIFVITIIINMFIQISTGVIFSFVLEHVIIIFLMLVMLSILWASTWATNMNKEIQIDQNKYVFVEGRASEAMLQRLKLCYLHGYDHDPQFLLCKSKILFPVWVDTVSLFCLIVVLKVLVRILYGHDFLSCNKVSDYGWSTRIIVAVQILVILLASLTTCFRGLNLFKQAGALKSFNWDHDDIDGSKGSKPFLDTIANEHSNWSLILRYVLGLVYIIAVFVLALPGMVIRVIYDIGGGCLNRMYTEPDVTEEYKKLMSENNMLIQGWPLTSCVENIRRWMSKVKREDDSGFHQTQLLLSKTPPSGQSLEQLYNSYNFTKDNEVSCLYLVFLLRIASVSVPSSFTGLLTASLSEVFDIICFVETKMNSLSFRSRKKCRLAKAMLVGKDFSIVVPKIFEGMVAASQSAGSNLERALTIIKGLKNVLPPAFIWDEVSFVMDFINSRQYTTIEELFTCMEQLFVDMLYIFLIQLPQAISKEVTECPVEEYTEKIRLMLKLVHQVKSLEGKVQWSFPVGTGITSLIPAQAFNDGNVASTCVTEDNEQNVINNAHRDEIIQVE